MLTHPLLQLIFLTQKALYFSITSHQCVLEGGNDLGRAALSLCVGGSQPLESRKGCWSYDNQIKDKC